MRCILTVWWCSIVVCWFVMIVVCWFVMRQHGTVHNWSWFISVLYYFSRKTLESKLTVSVSSRPFHTRKRHVEHACAPKYHINRFHHEFEVLETFRFWQKLRQRYLVVWKCRLSQLFKAFLGSSPTDFQAPCCTRRLKKSKESVSFAANALVRSKVNIV